MKKYFLLLSVLIIGISSCKKSSNDSANQAATDDALIKAYIATNNITATKDPSGLYYSIVTPGSGAYPTITSNIDVNYNGKLLDGTIFAPTANTTGALSNFIKGWQIGVPHINTGGRILLLIPSALAYGSSAPGGGIPANAVLVFTIDLFSFTN